MRTDDVIGLLPRHRDGDDDATRDELGSQGFRLFWLTTVLATGLLLVSWASPPESWSRGTPNRNFRPEFDGTRETTEGSTDFIVQLDDENISALADEARASFDEIGSMTEGSEKDPEGEGQNNDEAHNTFRGGWATTRVPRLVLSVLLATLGCLSALALCFLLCCFNLAKGLLEDNIGKIEGRPRGPIAVFLLLAVTCCSLAKILITLDMFPPGPGVPLVNLFFFDGIIAPVPKTLWPSAADISQQERTSRRDYWVSYMAIVCLLTAGVGTALLKLAEQVPPCGVAKGPVGTAATPNSHDSALARAAGQGLLSAEEIAKAEKEAALMKEAALAAERGQVVGGRRLLCVVAVGGHLAITTSVCVACLQTGRLSMTTGLDWEGYSLIMEIGAAWMILQAISLVLEHPGKHFATNAFVEAVIASITPYFADPFDIMKDLLFSVFAMQGRTIASKVIGFVSLIYVWGLHAYMILDRDGMFTELQASYLSVQTLVPLPKKESSVVNTPDAEETCPSCGSPLTKKKITFSVQTLCPFWKKESASTNTADAEEKRPLNKTNTADAQKESAGTNTPDAEQIYEVFSQIKNRAVNFIVPILFKQSTPDRLRGVIYEDAVQVCFALIYSLFEKPAAFVVVASLLLPSVRALSTLGLVFVYRFLKHTDIVQGYLYEQRNEALRADNLDKASWVHKHIDFSASFWGDKTDRKKRDEFIQAMARSSVRMNLGDFKIGSLQEKSSVANTSDVDKVVKGWATTGYLESEITIAVGAKNVKTQGVVVERLFRYPALPAKRDGTWMFFNLNLDSYGFAYNTTLLDLHLISARFDDKGVDSFSQAMAENKVLEKLKLTSCSFEGGAGKFAKALVSNTALQELHLNSLTLGSDFFDGWSNKTIQELHLNDVHIDIDKKEIQGYLKKWEQKTGKKVHLNNTPRQG